MFKKSSPGVSGKKKKKEEVDWMKHCWNSITFALCSFSLILLSSLTRWERKKQPYHMMLPSPCFTLSRTFSAQLSLYRIWHFVSRWKDSFLVSSDHETFFCLLNPNWISLLSLSSSCCSCMKPSLALASWLLPGLIPPFYLLADVWWIYNWAIFLPLVNNGYNV